MKTMVKVSDIPPLEHGEAMWLAATEYERFLEAVEGFRPEDWPRPTDCELWDVRALVAHVAGAARSGASMRESFRQQLAAKRAAKLNGTRYIDEWTDLHVRERVGVARQQLVEELRKVFPRALRGRRKMPGLMRRVPMTFPDPIGRRETLGYLNDTIFTRDVWMHRADLTGAIGDDMVLTPDHDGRIVADVVREWAALHGRPFRLVLEGLAGGAYGQGEDGEDYRLDAVEFCRMLAGRRSVHGLTQQQVPF